MDKASTEKTKKTKYKHECKSIFTNSQLQEGKAISEKDIKENKHFKYKKEGTKS